MGWKPTEWDEIYNDHLTDERKNSTNQFIDISKLCAKDWTSLHLLSQLKRLTYKKNKGEKGHIIHCYFRVKLDYYLLNYIQIQKFCIVPKFIGNAYFEYLVDMQEWRNTLKETSKISVKRESKFLTSKIILQVY